MGEQPTSSLRSTFVRRARSMLFFSRCVCSPSCWESEALTTPSQDKQLILPAHKSPQPWTSPANVKKRPRAVSPKAQAPLDLTGDDDGAVEAGTSGERPPKRLDAGPLFSVKDEDVDEPLPEWEVPPVPEEEEEDKPDAEVDEKPRLKVNCELSSLALSGRIRSLTRTLSQTLATPSSRDPSSSCRRLPSTQRKPLTRPSQRRTLPSPRSESPGCLPIRRPSHRSPPALRFRATRGVPALLLSRVFVWLCDASSQASSGSATPL